MKLKKSKSGFNFSWIVVIALLILLYSSYFLLYIPKQELLVTERGFRILKEYAENMHKKKDYYNSHFRNYSIFYAIREHRDYNSINSLLNHSNDSTDLNDVKDVINSLGYPDIMVINDNENSGRSADTLKVSSFENDFEPRIAFNIRNAYFAKNFDAAIMKLGIEPVKAKTFKQITQITLPVNDLMKNLKFDRLFSNIALLDSNEVIHNSDGSVVNSITNFEALKIDTVSKTQGGIFTELKIQGANMHVMILPIRFLDQRFYLAGFIKDTDFRKKTRTINGQLITIFSGILLLLLICMPILKIIFINRKERLNVRDAHNTTVSIILGTSLLTVIFIGTMKYYVVERGKANTRIEEISDKLVSNIENNFNHVFELAEKIVKDTAYGSDSEIRRALDSANYYTQNETVYEDSIPFNEILFMDDDGKAIKALTRTAFSNLVLLDLSNRNYFKNVKDDQKSWPCSKNENSPFESFFIESIKSYNTGFKETAVSFRFKKPLQTNKGSTPFLAITSHLPALYDQVLPMDVSFVVIDKNGEVMYHSNQSKILHENFVVESNFNPLIAGGINFRTVERTRITYNERQWLAQIVPLKNVPLYHITLIDLQYLDNKNTRIYLFTFYFILITFISIIVGMQLIQRLGTRKGFMKSKNWSFEWLIFNEKNAEKYRAMLFVQLVIVLQEVLLSILVGKPLGVLIVQLVLISISGFISYTLFAQQRLNKASILILIITGIMIVLLSGLSILGLFTILLLLLVMIPVIRYVVYRPGDFLRNTILWKLSGKYKARIIYLMYMFVWLMSLSVIPVVTYYYSIKHQENTLAKRAEMIHLAQTNLVLNKNHEYHYDKKWEDKTNGTGIDGYKVELLETLPDDLPEPAPSGPEKNTSFTERILQSFKAYLGNEYMDEPYRELRSPLTKDDYMLSLIQRGNDKNDWVFTESLYYTSPEMKGIVHVSSHNGLLNILKYILRLILQISVPALLCVLLIWYVFSFLSDIVLGTIVGKWNYPAYPEWKKVLSTNSINRILLVTFDGQKYAAEWNSESIEKIHAREILDEPEKATKYISSDKEIIWISGLDEFLLNYKQTTKIFPSLNELIRKEKRRIIIELPYDLDYIQEYFDEFIYEEHCTQAGEVEILNYLSTLKHLFSTFYRYTGSINIQQIEATLSELHGGQEKAILSEKQILADAHVMKLQYSHIWDNLSRMEKLILFDLADDGMMNFKNRFLINRLKMKGLLKLEPRPQVFDPSFQYFLKFSVNEDETTMLEHKLGKEGKWKNTRYLILLLLIPLVAFMFISQGTSIERVVGILTGVLALFSGAMKLMNTTWFTGISKQS